MAMELRLVALSFMLLFVWIGKSQLNFRIFDVTKYGVKPNAEISQALANAWKDACKSTSQSIVMIPRGTYKLNTIDLIGPCKSPIEFHLQGTLQASNPPIGSQGWVSFKFIDQLTLLGGGIFGGQGKAAWDKNDCDRNSNCGLFPMNLRFTSITNSLVRNITSKDSKYFHINVRECNNITFQRVNIIAPGNSPNTDGIHISRSTRVNVTSTHISTGDDCISLGDGNSQIMITNVTCGPGHGISVGSLGKYEGEGPVQGIIVNNCTLISTSNGLRIKTFQNSPTASTASDIHFEDIIMTNVYNPILIDQEYCPNGQCNKQAPSRIKISKVSFKNIRGTSATIVAIKLVCSSSAPCEDVEITDIDLTYNGGTNHTTSQCANVKPIITGKQNPCACS